MKALSDINFTNKTIFSKYIICISFSKNPFIFFIEQDFFEKKFHEDIHNIEVILNKINQNELEKKDVESFDLENYSLFFFNQNILCEQMPKIFADFLKSKNLMMENISEAIIDIGPGNLTSNRIMSCFFYPIFKLNKALKVRIIDHFSFYNSIIDLPANVITKFYDTRDVFIYRDSENNQEFEQICNKVKEWESKILIITTGRKDSLFCKIFQTTQTTQIKEKQEQQNILCNLTSDNLLELIGHFKKNEFVIFQSELKNCDFLKKITFQGILFQDFTLKGIARHYNDMNIENHDELKLHPIYLTNAI